MVEWKRDDLIELTLGSPKAALLQQGVVTGLFADLARPRTAQEVSAAYGWQVESCRALLDVYAAMGVVTLDERGHRLSSEAAP